MFRPGDRGRLRMISQRWPNSETREVASVPLGFSLLEKWPPQCIEEKKHGVLRDCRLSKTVTPDRMSFLTAFLVPKCSQ